MKKWDREVLQIRTMPQLMISVHDQLLIAYWGKIPSHLFYFQFCFPNAVMHFSQEHDLQIF